MKTCFRFLAAAVFSLVAAPDAHAGLIALWNFNDAGVSGSTGASNTAALFSVDQGSGTMTSSIDPASTTIVDFAGTLTNAQGSDPAGVALAIQNGTNGANNGAFVQFNESTVGFKAILVSFAIQATATGFNSDQFQYTTDGTTYVNFAAAFAPNLTSSGGFSPSPNGLMSFDLSSIAGLNNDANAGFRIVFGGGSTTSASGNNRIDNLLISGATLTTSVPEPASMALLGLGLAAVPLIARHQGRRAS